MIKRAIIIYTLGFLFSIALYSCCEEIYRVTANFEVTFTDIPEDTISIMPEDTIRGAFQYSLEAEVIREVVDLSQLSLIQSSYAWSCDMSYANTFVSESASLTLDKDFMIDNHVVKAGTNLLFLDWQGRGVPYKITEEEFFAHVYFAFVRLEFKEALLPRLHFPLDEYTFRTVVELENGKTLVSEEVRTIHIE